MHFVAENVRVLYLPISKNACTTLKTLMVELSDLSPERKAEIIAAGVQSYPPAHRTGLMLKDKTEGEVAAILADPGYFRFAILRDPFDRLVSAYVDKFVTHRTEPGYFIDSAPVVAAVQGVPEAEADHATGITFRQFLDHVVGQHPWANNNHWRPQIENFHRIRIDRLYAVDDLDLLETDLAAHLGRSVGIGQRNRLRTEGFSALEGAADMLPAAFEGRAKRVSTDSFFDDDLRAKAARYYAADITLHAGVRTMNAERRHLLDADERVVGLRRERDALAERLAAIEAMERGAAAPPRKAIGVNGLRRLASLLPMQRRH